MRKSFVIYLVLCTSLYAKAQYVAVDTTKLAQAYAAWQQESSPANQRVFFDAFPKNWMEFIATYQYGAPFMTGPTSMYTLWGKWQKRYRRMNTANVW